MERNSSKIVIWVIAIIFMLCQFAAFLPEDVSLNPNDYARITEMDYKAIVVDEPDCEGKIIVTERITFDVHAASSNNLFWELWRDLCEDTIDGLKVHYKVNSVKQILPDGSEIVWPESPKLYWDDSDYEAWNTRLGPGKWYHSPGPYNEYLNRYECVFFYVDGLYREKITFEIEYEMYNAVLRYGDCSDLYIAMYSGDTTKHLERLNAEILFENKDMPREGNYKVMTYGTNANSFPVKESATKNPGYYTFSFELDEDDLKFKKYNEYIEFELVSYGEDKHIFSENASRNYYYDDAVLDEIWEEQREYEDTPARYKEIKTTILFVCLGIATLVIIFGIGKIIKMKRKYPFYKADETTTTFRDIPSDLDPKFAAALVHCKDKKPEDDAAVYSSLLLSLARKDYVDLQEFGYSDMMITIKELEQPKPEIKTEEFVVPEEIINDDDSDGVMFSERFYSGEETHTDDEEKPSYYKYTEKYQPQHFYSSYVSNMNTAQTTEESIETPAFEETQNVIDTREALTSSEQHYLNLIKHHAKNGSITMSNLQDRISIDYSYTRDFVKNIKKSVVDNSVGLGYVQKANWQEPKKQLKSTSTGFIVLGVLALLINIMTYFTRIDLAFGGFFIVGIVAIITGIYLKAQSHKYVLLTEFGEKEYQKWRGLYNFLSSDTLINERTVVELPLWERYLVYATAFGIPGKVIKAIKIRCPIVMEENQSIVHNSYCRSGRIHTHSRHFHHSVRSGYHGHYNSYGGSGFGYGGGGRGGGGGGGGH